MSETSRRRLPLSTSSGLILEQKRFCYVTALIFQVYLTIAAPITLLIRVEMTRISPVRALEHVYIFFSFIFISRRLITLQCCSGFCHTLT